MELYQIIIALLGGLIAGCINTLAGNGSAITLSILTEVLGLGPNLANGTNRVGVFFQTASSSLSFYQNKKIDFSRDKHLVIWMTIGALAGVYVATIISNEMFHQAFKILMVVLFVVVLVRPKRWLIKEGLQVQFPKWISIPLFLAVGFYGGFIQMGFGIIFLAIMVLAAKYNIIQANAAKTLVVFIYCIPVLMIFHYKGLIDWKVGGILAIGQAIGGWWTAQFASRYESAAIWAYRVLVFMMALILLRLFGIWF